MESSVKKFERPPPPPRSSKPRRALVVYPNELRNRSCTTDETEVDKGSHFRRTVSAIDLPKRVSSPARTARDMANTATRKVSHDEAISSSESVILRSPEQLSTRRTQTILSSLFTKSKKYKKSSRNTQSV